jgi:DNA modification methylase
MAGNLPQPTQSPIAGLAPYKNNARTHSPQQVHQLAKSITEFGFVEPILIDGYGIIIAGHGRVEAAKLLGMKTVPTICIDHLTPEQIKAYRIAANRLAELAGWDNDLLKIELEHLIEHDFEVDLTGFETADIDLILEGSDESNTDSGADDLPDSDPDQPTVSQLRDLWLLGDHRLLCGDATSRDAFQTLMGEARAQMVITDSPYNLTIDGNVCGSGAIKHPEFAMASGEMSEGEFTSFLETVMGHLVAFSTDGSIHFLFMDWRHITELLTAASLHYGKPKNLCVWNKDNAGMGSFFRSKHELIFVFKNGTAKHINNFELGQNGRYRTNVWDYPGQNTFHKDRADELSMHPTVKPVAMIADAIRDCSEIAGIVLDCFGGSGTTIIAAEKTKRRAYAMELDPRYVDTSIRRWQAFTGKDAILAATGRTFAQEQEARHG